MEELAPGIRRWTAPHPEWRPEVEEVESYALVAGGALLLVDPLLPAGDDERLEPLLAELGLLAAAGGPGRTARHDPLPHAERGGALRALRAGAPHPHLGARQRAQAAAAGDAARGRAAGPGRAPRPTIAGGAAEAYTIGRPRRSEHPLYVPSLRAAVFGDAVVGAQGGLRFWNQSSGTGDAVVPRRLRPHARPAGRAPGGARAGHARAAGDRRRAGAAGAVPRVAAGADVLMPAACGAHRPLSPSGASPRDACAARCARG